MRRREPDAQQPDRKCIVELCNNTMDSKAVVELLEREYAKKDIDETKKQRSAGKQGNRACPLCGNPLYYISLTGEYYCFTCKKYVACTQNYA
jgi:hypothetical protein